MSPDVSLCWLATMPRRWRMVTELASRPVVSEWQETNSLQVGIKGAKLGGLYIATAVFADVYQKPGRTMMYLPVFTHAIL